MHTPFDQTIDDIRMRGFHNHSLVPTLPRGNRGLERFAFLRWGRGLWFPRFRVGTEILNASRSSIGAASLVPTLPRGNRGLERFAFLHWGRVSGSHASAWEPRS
jgi:hypothetical protein